MPFKTLTWRRACRLPFLASWIILSTYFLIAFALTCSPVCTIAGVSTRFRFFKCEHFYAGI